MATVIAARSRNRVIGVDGHLPWSIPADLRRFKELTGGHTVIMGRKTFESIGKPLPNRTNIVITSNRNWSAEGVTVVHGLTAAMQHAELNHLDEIFIIGGERVYQEALERNLVDKIELTLVNCFIEGDAFFPLTPPEKWDVTREEIHKADDKNVYDFAFLTYEYRQLSEHYKPSLYLPAARYQDQLEHMQNILNDGVCPFCPRWLSWYHENKIELETTHWVVTKNDNPYKGTTHDYLLIPKEHVGHFNELSTEAVDDFGRAIYIVNVYFGLEYGAIGMRFGDMSRTGGSVYHLHAHIKVGDVDNPDHTPVKFKMSSVPKENKAPTLNE